jgi:hypothetical protein
MGATMRSGIVATPLLRATVAMRVVAAMNCASAYLLRMPTLWAAYLSAVATRPNLARELYIATSMNEAVAC